MGRILYHGGPRGLQPGDTIEGGHTRRMQTLPGYKPGPDHLARNASTHMLNQWQARQITQAQALANRHQ